MPETPPLFESCRSLLGQSHQRATRSARGHGIDRAPGASPSTHLHSRRLLWPLGLIVLGIGLLLPPSQAPADENDQTAGQTSDRAKPATTGDKEEQAEEQPGDRLAGFARLLRIGQTSRNILIPAVERGSMTSLTKAEALTRRSEDYLDLIELVIQFYTADGEKDTRLVTPHAEFHLPSGILLSEHRTLVSRSDFDLEGDRFAFDTNSRRGRFEGNVTMIIHSMDRLRTDDRPSEPVELSQSDDEGSPSSDETSEPEPAEPEAAETTSPSTT